MNEALLNCSYQYSKYQGQNYSDDCLELENNEWTCISILKDYYQYIRIRNQDYYPLKIFLNVGSFKCTAYFSFFTSHPSETNNEKSVIIKQQKIIVIKKPQEIRSYLYFSILSEYSTQIKIKAWFQDAPYDRIYNLCYENQQKKNRAVSLQNSDEDTIQKHFVRFATKPKRSLDRTTNFHVETLDIRIEKAMRKKIQIYSNDMIRKYQQLILNSYKQVFGLRMMEKHKQKWIQIINLFQICQQIYAHFKLNKILKYMTNQPKVYAIRWKHNKEKQPQLNQRVLTISNNVLKLFSTNIHLLLYSKISLLLRITLKDLKFIKQQAQLQSAFQQFYLKIRKIQNFYFKSKSKFLFQIEFMIDYCKNDMAILISKLRRKKIIKEFYRVICAKHKIEFKRFSQSQANNDSTLITSYLSISYKPKLHILRQEKLLLEIIEQIK